MVEKVFESKITRLQASKTRVYPSIRLPKEYGDIIGKKAEIHPTIHEGKQAFLVVVDHESLNSDMESPTEKRLKVLENEIECLKSAFYENNCKIIDDSIKEDSPGRIRTSVFGSKGRKD